MILNYLACESFIYIYIYIMQALASINLWSTSWINLNIYLITKLLTKITLRSLTCQFKNIFDTWMLYTFVRQFTFIPLTFKANIFCWWRLYSRLFWRKHGFYEPLEANKCSPNITLYCLGSPKQKTKRNKNEKNNGNKLLSFHQCENKMIPLITPPPFFQ